MLKLKAPQRELLKLLKPLLALAKAKTTLPILSFVLLNLRDGLMTATTTDLNHHMVLQAEFEDPKAADGEVCLSAKRLFDTIAGMPTDADVTLSEGANHWVTVSATKANGKPTRTKLGGMHADEYPTIPKAPKGDTIHVTGAVFFELLKRVAYCTSNDENRPNMQGVFFRILEGDEGILEAQATDGHRMAWNTQVDPLWSEGPPGNCATLEKAREGFPIPGQGIKLFSVFDKEENIAITLHMDTIEFRQGAKTLGLRTMPSKCFNSAPLLSKKTDAVIKASKPDLMSLLKRARAALSTTGKINASFGAETIAFHVDNSMDGIDFEEELEYSGGDASDIPDRGINADYLAELCRHLPGDVIVFGLLKEIGPIYLYSDDVDNLISLVMPMVS